jgi:hypothetical protein
MSFAHQDGNATVVHAFADPYYETQLFNPDPSLANALTDDARFSDPNTVPFPLALFNNVLQIAGIKQPPAGRLEAHMLLAANKTSPVTWYACAPGGTSGKLSYSYDFTVRPGVTIGKGYTPFVPKRESCTVPWSVLNEEAQAALGNSDLDIREAIVKQVPASIAPKVKRNPVVDCYASLTAPALSGGSGKTITPNAGQPFPFYGEISVSRG